MAETILQASFANSLSHLRIDSERLLADFEALAQIGATMEGGVTRLAFTYPDQLARAWMADRILDAGFLLRDDDAGNQSGVLLSEYEHAGTLLLGSHLDTVENGGRYDGSVGVLAGMEVMRVLQASGARLPFHIEIVDFADDEGTWESLLGARALTGVLRPEMLNDTRIDRAPLRAALSQAGLNVRNIFNAAREPAEIVGYLELHVEHGTRLERASTPIGAVTGIVGRSTHLVTFHGEKGHSGTSDMYQRRDALRGAALFIVRAHDAMRERYGDGIFHCGNIEVHPGAFNIIPDLARITAECRHVDGDMLLLMETLMNEIARQCASTYGLTVSPECTARMPTAQMDSRFITLIEASADTLGLSHLRLASYAGHAAQFLGHFTPSGMIFVPSVRGIGHSPDESTRWDDVVNGANVLLHTILRLAVPMTGAAAR